MESRLTPTILRVKVFTLTPLLFLVLLFVSYMNQISFENKRMGMPCWMLSRISIVHELRKEEMRCHGDESLRNGHAAVDPCLLSICFRIT